MPRSASTVSRTRRAADVVEVSAVAVVPVAVVAPPAVAGTAVAGTAVAGTAVAGTAVAGTAVAGTAVAGTAVAGTVAGTAARTVSDQRSTTAIAPGASRSSARCSRTAASTDSPGGTESLAPGDVLP